MATFKKYTNKKGEFWLFTVYLGIDPMTGNNKRTTHRGFKTKQAAKIALDRLLHDIEVNGIENKQMPKTFKDIYELWLEYYKDTVKESTLYNVKLMFKRTILPAFGNLRIKQITGVYCQKIVNDWAKKYVTANQMAFRTSVVFKYALKLEYIQRNPMEYVTIARNRKRSKPKKDNFYSKDELKTFLSFLDHNKQPFNFFRVLSYTGLRKSELLALRWSDIDFDNNQISVSKTLAVADNKLIVQTPKTENSVRVVNIDDSTMHILKRWRLTQRSIMLRRGFNTGKRDQLIFCTLNNKYLNTTAPNEWLVSVYKSHPDFKQINVHGFRHTCASLMFASGADVKQVQMRLGHSNVQTTLDIYTHVTEQSERETVDTFSQYMEQ